MPLNGRAHFVSATRCSTSTGTQEIERGKNARYVADARYCDDKEQGDQQQSSRSWWKARHCMVYSFFMVFAEFSMEDSI